MSEKMKLALYKELQSIQETWKELAPESPQIEKVKQLKRDIEEDYFIVVIVGEFKNGKSTFLNALLEEPLLPMNVTPTTAAIHMVYQGKDREMAVVKSDGEQEKLPLTGKSLYQFTAQADFDPNTVNYIKISHPSSLLDNRVVLVDTPGVNDLNTHRADVTHQFVPRADGILFMVDVMAPFRKSELEFFEDYLKNETDHILFIANFIDQLDDEDEIEEVLKFANQRLAQVSGKQEHAILPLSAREALEAVMNDEQELFELSGMETVKKALAGLLQEGTKQQQKVKRYQHRFKLIKAAINREIEQERMYTHQSVEQLQEEKAQLHQLIAGEEDWKAQLEDYIEERTSEIKFMVLKSIEHFENWLKRELIDAIEYHSGDNIESFVERDLSRKIKNELSRWIDHYSPSIFTLFRKLEIEISTGLSKSFRQNVHLSAISTEVDFEAVLDIHSPETSNTSLTSGALVGGASALAVALGASVLFPIVAFVGQPWLSKRLKEREWQKMKPIILETTDTHLSHIFMDFRRHMNKYIEVTTKKIQDGSSYEFKRMVSYLQSTIQQQVKQKCDSEQKQNGRLEELEKFQQHLIGEAELQNV